MTVSSYSQFGEDVIAWAYLRHKINGVYVDVGASDPYRYSNTALFYEKGWSGVCVEPLRTRAEHLQHVRARDLVINSAVGTCFGKTILTVFGSDMLSTTCAEEEYVDKGERVIQHLEVGVVPLSYVMAMNHAAKADLLSVDTEGSELEVLASNDWGKFRPTIVIAETKKYMETTRTDLEITRFMKTVGYEWLADTGLNTLYALPGVNS